MANCNVNIINSKALHSIESLNQENPQTTKLCIQSDYLIRRICTYRSVYNMMSTSCLCHNNQWCLSCTRFYNILGHCGNDLMNSTAKAMGITLMGKLKKCMNCAMEKILKAKHPERKSKEVYCTRRMIVH